MCTKREREKSKNIKQKNCSESLASGGNRSLYKVQWNINMFQLL